MRAQEEADEGAFLRATPEEREHRANILRLRVAVLLGTLVWPSFGLMDWLMCASLYPQANVQHVLLVRLAATPLHILFYLRLVKRPWPSPLALLTLDSFMFAWAAASIGILSAFLGGIAGPYTPGVFLVLICRNAFLIQPWRRSVIPNALVVLAHFAALFVAEWLWDGSVFSVGPEQSRSLMMLHFSSLTCGAVMLTAASNTTWALRRRVFEARQLGRYRLIDRLAEGGYGEVWRAYHAGLRQEVAIKVLRSDLAESERAMARFKREIDALCQLRHPHTIRILDYGVTTDGIGYYAMELLEGVTLAQLIDRAGVLEAPRVIHLGLQVVHALSEAHQHGIVHRDIKPSNVFVLSSGAAPDFAKLLDFGIAKLHGEIEPESHVTRTGLALGTPGFMAPEVMEGRPADFRSDVYGVGALLFYMLRGEPPFDSAEVALRGKIPVDLEHVIARCLARRPESRYEDAGALAQALGALKDAYAWRPSAEEGLVAGSSAGLPTRTLPP